MIKIYILRLDDASEYMDKKKWNYLESILDKYQIMPIVGVIPDNCDPYLTNNCQKDEFFWEIVKNWENKGWEIAMHGYKHIYNSNSGGINPVNMRSEFAGLSYEIQKKMIKKGYELLKSHNINPNIFFAPSHTYDLNTIKSIKKVTNISIISDSISNDIYYENGLYFLPQQSGKVRKLPLKIVTFCYHPDLMTKNDFDILEKFIKTHKKSFISFKNIVFNKRKKSFYDKLISFLYFLKRKKVIK